MCLNKKIIVSPKFIQQTAFHRYTVVSTPNGDFSYHRGAFHDFDFKKLHPSRMGVTESNIDQYVFVDPQTGDCMPMYIVTECGKCPVCITKKRVSIKHRMILEQRFHGDDCVPIFLTLTYRDDCLPPTGVNVRDVQLFMKRLRSYLDYHHEILKTFRYVCFSEYGKLRGRPHYHLILFGVRLDSPRDIVNFEADISKCWNKGFVYAKNCNFGCFNYVSKYVSKGSNVPPGMNPNFRLSSRKNGGIGVPAFTDHSLYYQLIQTPHPVLYINVLGKTMKVYVPKEIRDNLFKSPTMIVPQQYRNKFKRFCYLNCLIHTLINDFDEFAQYVDAHMSVQPQYFRHFLCREHYALVPSEIYNKFAFMNFTPQKCLIPFEFRSKNVLKTIEKRLIIKEYVNLYKDLQNFDIDFGRVFEMRYLRSKFVDNWNLTLAEFAQLNPDRDPIALADFNAIIVESIKSLDCQ